MKELKGYISVHSSVEKP